MDAEKIAEAVLLDVFTLAFPANKKEFEGEQLVFLYKFLSQIYVLAIVWGWREGKNLTPPPYDSFKGASGGYSGGYWVINLVLSRSISASVSAAWPKSDQQPATQFYPSHSAWVWLRLDWVEQQIEHNFDRKPNNSWC